MDATVNRQFAENLLSLHDVGDLRTLEPVSEPGTRTRWRLTTTRGSYQLWLHPPRPFWVLVLQKDVAAFIRDHRAQLGGVDACAPLRNLGGGHLFPWQDRCVSLLEEPLGRQLAVFERTPEAAAQVGAFLGRFHRRTATLRLHRRHHARLSALGNALRSVGHAVDRTTQATLLQACERVRHRARKVPHAVVHGTPGLDAFRFAQGALVQLMPLEEPARGPALSDVAHALLQWAWDGPQPHAQRAHALLQGYQQHRPLGPVERRQLGCALEHAALAQAVAVVCTYVDRQRGPARGFRDPGPHLQQLAALQQGSARALVAALRRGVMDTPQALR
jgi:Ser/Thr protein kinase RdoA (MazF antagonist)